MAKSSSLIAARSLGNPPFELVVSPGVGKPAGKISIEGSKNASLALLGAAALSAAPVHLKNVPRLSDVFDLIALLERTGATISMTKNEVRAAPNLNGAHTGITALDPVLAQRLRGSIYAAAYPYVKTGSVFIPKIGGDDLPGRSLSPHLRAFRGFGARVEEHSNGFQINGGPNPNTFELNDRYAGVTASCLAIMIASALHGTSLITGVSSEPEVDELIVFLVQSGAKIDRFDDRVQIRGPTATNTQWTMSPDRTVWGTYAIACVISNQNVTLPRGSANQLRPILSVFDEIGVRAIIGRNHITLSGCPDRPIDITAGAFPQFPSDLIPPLSMLLAATPGTSRIRDKVYGSRFAHIPQLAAIGLRASEEQGTLLVTGGRSLQGGRLTGMGIRETAALALAGLLSTAPVHLSSISALGRGYQDFDGTLRKLGLNVARSEIGL